MEFLIDDREPTQIVAALRKENIPIIVKRLDVGDYTFNHRIGIERKTVRDLCGSVYSGRLFNQLKNLAQYEKPILVVIGDVPPLYKWMRVGRGKRVRKVLLTDAEKKSIEKTILSNFAVAMFSFGISVINIKDEEQFIQFLVTTFFKHTKKEKSLKPVKRKGSTLKEVKSDMISCLPGFGRAKSDLLAEKYTIAELAKLPLKELKKVPDVGDKRAKTLHKYLNS